MQWNKHPEIKNKHAFLSPSKCTWIRKTDDELAEAWFNSFATDVGTITHAFAADCVLQRHGLEEGDWRHLEFELLRNQIPHGAFDLGFIFPTVLNYVNDAIGYNMDPEIPLSYSDKCWGTADAIQFRRRKLRIHDLKTGTTPAKIDQLMIYAALFFLEYREKPEKASVELRIYQAGDILVCEPTAEEIREVMDQVIHANAFVQNLKEE